MQVEVVSTSSSTRKLTLKYSEQFEHDYDNDNYSNYVKDVSVHTGDSYQSECAMARIYWTSWVSFTDRSGPFSIQAPER